MLFRYKTPFLRGDMDPGIDTYQRMEELMAEDIDHWLCNLYFDVVLLPRYMTECRGFFEINK